MKLLIIGPSWVGDMLIANSLFQHLIKQYPDHELDVLAPAWSQSLLSKMPEVANILDMPINHREFLWRKRKQIGNSLRQKHYARAWVLPNSWKSALIPFWANIPILSGYQGELRYGLLNDIRKKDTKLYPSLVMQYNALAYSVQDLKNLDAASLKEKLYYPYPHLSVSIKDKDNTAKAMALILPSINFKLPFIALCPGAEFGPAKCWPHNHYAKLANRLINDGFIIHLLGSAKDSLIARRIIAMSTQKNRIFDLTGKTTLAQAVDILSMASAVVSNDSGLMHVAAALQRPQVALFGPTSPHFTPPLSKKARTLRLIEGYHPMRQANDSPEGYHYSLINLQPSMVYDSLKVLIDQEK